MLTCYPIPILYGGICTHVIVGSFGNKGCSGGDTISSFKYIITNEGVDKASYYPYKAQVGFLYTFMYVCIIDYVRANRYTMSAVYCNSVSMGILL